MVPFFVLPLCALIGPGLIKGANLGSLFMIFNLVSPFCFTPVCTINATVRRYAYTFSHYEKNTFLSDSFVGRVQSGLGFLLKR